jgi:hypothetical protein
MCERVHTRVCTCVYIYVHAYIEITTHSHLVSTGSGICWYEGVEYGGGDEWTASDGCNMCTCKGMGAKCTRRPSCPAPTAPIPMGPPLAPAMGGRGGAGGFLGGGMSEMGLMAGLLGLNPMMGMGLGGMGMGGMGMGGMGMPAVATPGKYIWSRSHCK